ncbi:MFS transporter [Streptomyces sp. WMMC500]|uniref:MFS transporter n=1 Tax=Streptomyces sp. WMMC500 TaxID=3015154 RepID=UPI00248BFC28|nr:MFS transporter [Streptomyces sp. WMMC500]WBB60268.1 MFS transporter [Streptomyces sp. WMMC500]
MTRHARLPAVPELLRDRPFRRYWTAQSVSLLGDEVHRIALPLAAVLLLGAGATDLGLLTAAALLPALLFSVPAGAWADRRRSRRRVMIAADLGRMAAVASVPVAYALDALTLTHLYAAAFAVGTLGALFNVCAGTVYVALLPVERYVQGSSLLNGSRALAFTARPGLGGALVQMATAPFALLLDALSYLVSALFLGRISPAEPPPAVQMKSRATTGIRWVLRTPAMRACVAAVATLNFFNFIFQALFVLYATRELGLGPGLLGVVLGAGGIGGLAGAVLAARVVARFGVGPAMTAGFAGFSVPLTLIPLADGPTPLVAGMLLAAEFASAFGVMILDISANSYFSAAIPDALRSRVLGALQTVNFGVRPLGALAGGALGGALGLRPTLWVATAGATLAVLWLLPSPVPRIRRLPGAGPAGRAAAGEPSGAA